MIRAVVDTNVLVSGIVGFGNSERAPAEILQLWHVGRFTLVVSEHILAELARTFEASYFRSRLTSEQIARVLLLLREEAEVVSITVTVQGVATHPEDDLILATALSGDAQYLVSGDTRLQALGNYHGIRIVKPRDFVDSVIAQ